MATINTTLASMTQAAYLTTAEVAALLVGARYTAWAAASATDQENAIYAVNDDVESVPWIGAPLWCAAYDFQPQRHALPTIQTGNVGGTVSILATNAGDGSTTTTVNVSHVSLPFMRAYLVGGAVIVADSTDVDFQKAAKISAYDSNSETLTVESAVFSEALDDKAIYILSPLHSKIREAIAIQAYYHLANQGLERYAEAQHLGKTTTTGDPGTVGSLRQKSAAASRWHPEAWSRIRQYVLKSVGLVRA